MTQKSLAMRARTRYTTPEEFLTAHGRYFDHQGVFVRTQQKKPPGTPVRFEFQLADGQIVFRGEGMVTQPATINLPEGEGLYLKLTRLDRQSKVLFQRIREQLGPAAPSSSGLATSADEIGDLSHPPGPPPGPPIEPPASPEPGPPSPYRQTLEGGLTSADLEIIADAIEDSLDSVLLPSLADSSQPAWPQDSSGLDMHPPTRAAPAPVERHPVPPSASPRPIQPFQAQPPPVGFAMEPSPALSEKAEPPPVQPVGRTEEARPQSVEPVELPGAEPDEEQISDDFEIVVSPEIEVEQEVIVDLSRLTPRPEEPEELVAEQVPPQAPEQPEAIEDVTEMAKIAESLKKQWEADITQPAKEEEPAAQPPEVELAAETIEEEIPAQAPTEELAAETIEEEISAQVSEEELPVLQPLRFVEEEEEKPVISDLIADLLTEKKAAPSPRPTAVTQKPAAGGQPASATDEAAPLLLEDEVEEIAEAELEATPTDQPPVPSPAPSRGFFKRLFGRK